jgi:pimeloyl-ACP methyl ester carboxylesterase
MKLAAYALLSALAATPAASFAPPPVVTSSSLYQKEGSALLSRTSLKIATTTTTTASSTTSQPPSMPSHSPATSLPNQIYKWRGYDIRYQVTGPPDADHTLLLVHGLFVNSDHWRKTLTGLHALNDELHNNDGGDGSTTKKKKIRIYAIDLLGSGWSSKPSKHDPNAQLVSGENGRFINCDSTCYRESNPTTNPTSNKQRLQKIRTSSTLQNTPLGTSSGGNRLASSLELRHPLRSPYNFYTWAEQIADFTHDVIHPNHNDNTEDNNEASSSSSSSSSTTPPKVTLIANSIGTMSSLQSILDEPQLFNGCMVINPNFRELHMAEVPFSSLTMPIVRQVQSLLRTNGHGLFASLAKPNTVKEILKEPYAVVDAVDDELVQVLLDPLLTPGADDVVFDTLSYSAGPLPEQQLSSMKYPKETCPTWVIYGKADPWTPSKRVDNLKNIGRVGDAHGESTVEKIVALEGVGHCPHDESPEVVNRLILEFLDRLSS